MRFDAKSVTIDVTSFTPRDALQTLEKYMHEGAKYHQLRGIVANWFAEVVPEPATFVVEFVEIVFVRLSEHGYRETEDDDGDAMVCMYLMLESLGRVPGAREGRTRRRFATNVTRGVVKSDRARARAGKLVKLAITDITELSIAPVRPVVRLIETFGLELEDLSFASRDEASDAVTRYINEQIDRGKQRSAMALVFHFNLDQFATFETLLGLVQAKEYTIALEFASMEPRLTKQWIELCINDGVENHNHASLRNAYKAVTTFKLEHEFPDVRTVYYKSTISRMIGKGSFEAALRRAGSDEELQRWVVESLAATDQFEYAVEYANRCGLYFNCDANELAEIQARRRATFFQLPRHLDGACVFVDDEKSLLEASHRYLWNQGMIGIDTEWGADVGEDADNADRSGDEVAILQIASQLGVVILDVPKLLYSCPDTLETTIGKMFEDEEVLKLGFAVQEDLRRLSKCHKAFKTVQGVVDLQKLWKLLVSKARTRSVSAPWSTEAELLRYQPVGLSALVAAVLGKPLDKMMRMSDWSRRPLTQSQMEYAALDAWTLVEVHRTLLEAHGAHYSPLLERVRKSYDYTR